MLLKHGKVVEALLSVEHGRAQADLMKVKYGFQTTSAGLGTVKRNKSDKVSCLPPTTVFVASEEQEINFWLYEIGKDVKLRRKKISDNSSKDDVTVFFSQSLVQIAYQDISVRAFVECEDRSLDTARNGHA